MTPDELAGLLSHLDTLAVSGTELGREHARKCTAALRRFQWQPLESAPPGLTPGSGFNHIMFLGYSKARSFAGPVVVSGWMDHDRKPVHNYSYKLTITHWMPIPETSP